MQMRQNKCINKIKYFSLIWWLLISIHPNYNWLLPISYETLSFRKPFKTLMKINLACMYITCILYFTDNLCESKYWYATHAAASPALQLHLPETSTLSSHHCKTSNSRVNCFSWIKTVHLVCNSCSIQRVTEQHAFRKGISIENTAFRLTDSEFKSINQKMHVGGILHCKNCVTLWWMYCSTSYCPCDPLNGFMAWTNPPPHSLVLSLSVNADT
jgi:hypothetical protein